MRSLLALLVLCCGCTPVFSKPVTVSTKFGPHTQVPEGAKLVKGRSCTRLTLLFIPISVGSPDEAFEEALAQVRGADMLLDWRMRTDAIAIVGSVIYFESCLTVEGYAVDSRQLAASGEPGLPLQSEPQWHRRRDEP
jgi:hypothetical protein